VFENRVLRRVFGSKTDEVREEVRKLHNKKLYDLCFSPNVLGTIKSRIMRWVGHVYLWETDEVHTGFSGGDLKERDRSEDLGIDRRIILKRILRKWDREHGLD